MSSLIPIIIAGGRGRRLWPLSTKNKPKPFVLLPDNDTLIRKVYKRVCGLPNIVKVAGKPFVVTVTNKDYFSYCSSELASVGLEGVFLLEATSRDTAPAISVAANYVRDTFGGGVDLLILPADHVVSDEASFHDVVETASRVVTSERQSLVTFGITPTFANPEFGYIEAGEPLSDGFRVNRFVEKPDISQAEQYIAAGNYFWNSGMLYFETDTFLKELSEHAIEISDVGAKCWESICLSGEENKTVIHIPDRIFSKASSISIDYALLERSGEVVVVPAYMDWNDVGSWDAFSTLDRGDKNRNFTIGKAVISNCENVFVYAQDHTVGVVGIKNAIIVAHESGVLVSGLEQSKKLSNVVDKLEEMDVCNLDPGVSETRPWGNFKVLADENGYKVKRIEVHPGGRLSLQRHSHRAEHWVVVKGEALVTLGEKHFKLRENQSILLGQGETHRLENETNEVLIVIEVQYGDYLGEDDIERFEDNYGRA